MARLGAKVLQARSVEFAKKYDVPVVVKSSFSEGSGTLVTRPEQDMEQVVVAGVTSDRNQAKITLTRVADRPGIAAKLFGRIAAADIVVDMIIQNASEGGLTDISFTVSRSDAQQALALARQSLADLGAEEATLQTNIAKVSIVGVGMQSHAGVAARMFEALAAEKINILMISTSEIKISCVIEDKYTELAVRVLHDAFQLDAGGALTVPHKYVYLFANGVAEGQGAWRDLLGGKGAGLAEMTALGIRVPPGCTISTEACRAYYAAGNRHPDGMWDELLAGAAEDRTGGWGGVWGPAPTTALIRALGGPGIDAWHDGHGAQHRPQRRDRAGPHSDVG